MPRPTINWAWFVLALLFIGYWLFVSSLERIDGNVVLGSIQVDEARFPRFGGDYQSADYGSAANRVDLAINGGVGSVRVIGEG